MKPKIKTKSNSHLKNNNIQDKNKLIKKENNKDKNFSKKKIKTLQKNSKSKKKNNNITSKKESKSNTKNNSKNLINKKIINNLNIEDSSTNCLSGNKKNPIPKNDNNILNSKEKEKTKENFICPLLMQKESDIESHFINFQLGEKDSYTDSTLRSNMKNNCNDKFMNINNIKLNINNDIKNNNNKNYDYCDVDKNIGKNENDSMEIYDFSDKTNVDYVLKNFSALSCSKSGKEKSKSSFILDDFNEEDINGNKNINIIKVFNTKQSICDNCTQIKLNKNKNINDTFIKNNNFFKPTYKY